MRRVSDPSPALRTVYDEAEVSARIDQLVARLAADYAERRPILVVIAEGARRFADALALGLATRGVEVEPLEVRAQRTRGQQLRPVELSAPPPERFRARDLLVIDDIADEGRTLDAVLEYVGRGGPRSCRVAVLVDKRARRVSDVVIDYAGFRIDEGWVVGFGMDLDGRYRELDRLAVCESG
jgi:hypoxanthine phosphoribosyltransferase